MKHLLLVIFFFIPFLCLGMETQKELPTKLEHFELLSDKLKLKIVSHLFDKHVQRKSPNGMCTYSAVDKIKPFLKTCKRYYLNDLQFSGSLLEIICEEFKFCGDTLVTSGMHLPTPACKQFLISNFTKFKTEIDRVLEGSCPVPCQKFLNDVKAGKVRFKISVTK